MISILSPSYFLSLSLLFLVSSFLLLSRHLEGKSMTFQVLNPQPTVMKMNITELAASHLIGALLTFDCV